MPANPIMAIRASNEHYGTDSRNIHGFDGQTSMDSEKTIEAGESDHIREGNKVDVPPDGGYGWVCTACVFLINAHTWGVNSVSSAPCLL